MNLMDSELQQLHAVKNSLQIAANSKKQQEELKMRMEQEKMRKEAEIEACFDSFYCKAYTILEQIFPKMLIEAGNPSPKELPWWGRIGWVISSHDRKYYYEMSGEENYDIQPYKLVFNNNNIDTIAFGYNKKPQDSYTLLYLFRELFDPKIDLESNLIAFRKHLIKVINDQGEFE
jgi:hypothetical protein